MPKVTYNKPISAKKTTKKKKTSTKTAKNKQKKEKLTENQQRAKTKHSRVEREVTNFRKYIKKYIDISPLLSDQIRECAYLKVTLRDIKASIDEHGVMYYYTNKAKETNLTKNPLLSEYKNMVKEYNLMLKLLQEAIKDYLPQVKLKQKDESDEEQNVEPAIDPLEQFEEDFKVS